MINLILESRLIVIDEAVDENERPVHDADIVLGNLLEGPLLIEDDSAVVASHAPRRPHYWRPELVKHHLSKAILLMLHLLRMGNSSNALRDLLQLHLDDLLLQVLSFPHDLGFKNLHRVRFSMEIYLFSKQV